MMSNDNYDPTLNNAGFMDLVCALQAHLKNPDEIKLLAAMPHAQRHAALQLDAAAKHYIDVVQGHSEH